MDKNVKVSLLLDIYGKLLTDKQYQMLDDYYNNDLSLAEVAENVGITRQAVRDNLLKGEKNLNEYESKLGLLKKSLKNKKALKEIDAELDKLIDKKSSKELIEKSKELKKKIHKLEV
jgi:hypothetical protein